MEINESKSVRYGGSSALLTTCPRCQRSPDQHPLANIRPSDETTAAVKRFSDLLSDHVTQLYGVQKLTREEFMIGAMVADVGGKRLKWVANSGASILNSDSMSGGWTVIHDMPAELGTDDCFGVGGQAFTPTLADGYSRTQCAAPKLLCNLLKLAGEREIRLIEMTELWWKNPLTKSETPNRNWAQLEPVPSCDHCKSFLPQMLCNRPDIGMEGFTPEPVLPLGTQWRELRCAQGHLFKLALSDDAWRPFGVHADGINTPCPTCGKAVPCHDPKRPRTSAMDCVNCGKAFLSKDGLPMDTWVKLACPLCKEVGKYRKYKLDKDTRVEGKKLGGGK